tara:strand:- start:1000 stop:1140 length:141 start_codon:yes stop_codon:yes gene_type:complete
MASAEAAPEETATAVIVHSRRFFMMVLGLWVIRIYVALVLNEKIEE